MARHAITGYPVKGPARWRDDDPATEKKGGMARRADRARALRARLHIRRAGCPAQQVKGIIPLRRPPGRELMNIRDDDRVRRGSR